MQDILSSKKLMVSTFDYLVHSIVMGLGKIVLPNGEDFVSSRFIQIVVASWKKIERSNLVSPEHVNNVF